MSELNIIIDNFGHNELKEYLMSLNGIFDVKITNDEYLDIYLKYDSSLITLNIIKMEIFNFLDIMKNPSMIAFNKYSKYKTLDYTIIRDKICCEYCFKGAIDDLFNIAGIEEVNSNYLEKKENIIIDIKYNPNIISEEEMRKKELKLNI